MGNCRHFEDMLARFIHGEILLTEREVLEEHISVCRRCEALYRDIKAIDCILRDAPEKQVEPPPWLRAKIIASLPEEGAGRDWRRFGRWAGAAAAAACALLAVFLVRGVVTTKPRVASAPPPQRAAVAPSSPAAPGGTAGTAGERAAVPAKKAAPSSRERTLAPPPRITVIKEVRIFFYYPRAARVAVTGDFNRWDPQGVPLRSAGKPGLWETTLRLPPGAYSYNFIVDGNLLIPDPDAPDQMPDGFGGTDSILLVKGGNGV